MPSSSSTTRSLGFVIAVVSSRARLAGQAPQQRRIEQSEEFGLAAQRGTVVLASLERRGDPDQCAIRSAPHQLIVQETDAIPMIAVGGDPADLVPVQHGVAALLDLDQDQVGADAA